MKQRSHSYISALFGLLTSALCLLTAAPTLAAPEADPFAGDLRVSAKQSMRQLNLPIRDLLADLSQQTGIRFFADATVGDDRITLITHDRSLGETLRSIAAFFQYDWKKDGAGQNASYTLKLQEAARLAQQESRKARLSQLADLIKQEAQVYDDLTQMSASNRDDLIGGLPQKLAEETDLVKLQLYRMQHGALQEMGDSTNRHFWVPVIYHLMKSIPKEKLISLLDSGVVYVANPRLTGSEPIPPGIEEEIQKAGKSENGYSSSYTGKVNFFRLRFAVVAGHPSYVRWHVMVGQRHLHFNSASQYTGILPAAAAYLTSEEQKLAANKPVGPKDWKSDPALAAPVTIDVPQEQLDTRPTDFTTQRANRLSDALEKMDKSHPLDVIADAFWSTKISGADMRNLPIGEALNRLSGMTHHLWWKQDGFVMVRSEDLASDRDAEPPSTAVARWSDQIARGLFTIDDLAEIAALPDTQASTLQDMATHGLFPIIYSPLQPARSQLVLWQSLDRSQRRKASSAGLVYKDLKPDQQKLYLLASTDPSSAQMVADAVDESRIAGTRLHITTQEASYWGVRRPGPASTWRLPHGDAGDGNSLNREEALKRFQQLDNSITLKEIQVSVHTLVVFTYETEQGLLSRARFTLPARWESGEAQ